MIETYRFKIFSKEEIAKYRFGHCVGCKFYPCELTGEYTMYRDTHPGNDYFSYNPDEIKNYCSLMTSGLHPVECGSKRVTDGIGDHFKIKTHNNVVESTKGRWEPRQPVFISAQTGQGKNYFIENNLLPYIRDLNYRKSSDQKVLIISNRLALKKQIEERIDGEDKDKVYPFSEIADCITYQGFLNRVEYFESAQRNRISSYIYVICDEAHFFTSDAMFNPDTSRILSGIVNTFKSAIRVYMSATPYDCFRYICKYEDTITENVPFVFYHFKRDFSYLATKYYRTFDELKDIVVRSVIECKEKWIIFIDDKEKCSEFKTELEEYGQQIEKFMDRKILAVNADSKTEKNYQHMVEKESLDKDTYVLITTSVLDNGVNIRGINNIAVSEISKVKTIQMVGRARLDSREETKTLYLKRFDERHMSKRIETLGKRKDAYHSYDLAFKIIGDRKRFKFEFFTKYYHGSYNDWIDAKHWFRLKEKPIELYANEIARSMVDILLPTYESISKEMGNEDTGESIDLMRLFGQKYLEHQLSWFGKTYSIENNLKKPEDDLLKFIKFLERYAKSGENLSGEESKNEFKKEFTRLHDQVFQIPDSVIKNKDRASDGYGLNLMNKELDKYNIDYQITADKKTSFWRVVKLT